jgi:large subunit ribosomal protein L13
MVTKLKHYNPSDDELVNDWQVIDADEQVLGRLATRVAKLLMGKHKPGYVPHLLSGDFVIVTNAANIRVTGLKAKKKVYRRYSQYPGNLKEISFERMKEKSPERILELAVKGMLPKNKLGRRMLKRLKVYAGVEHQHSAQVIGSQLRLAREVKSAADSEALLTDSQAEPSIKKRVVKKSATAKKAPVKKSATAKKAPVKKSATVKNKRAKKPTTKPPTGKRAPAKKTGVGENS